ncbi:MAG: hypothetical protein K5849_07490 [Bacteroidales bacterium]|nr:hypothetical protein [Bacteroidales bacterium]
MKRILFFALAFFATVCASAQQTPDPAVFAAPPAQYQTAAWWHWMDGALTEEGVTKDLEAMKAQGISNATVLNIYRLIGIEDGFQSVKFDSPAWYALFRHAVEEADRLGMQIGAANCDGWSESGGPWITPETSMKQYTWRKTFVKGSGREQRIPLALPFSKERFYRDVAVVAYRDAGPNSFVTAAPQISCHGGYPVETLIKSHKYHDETRHLDLFDDFPAEILIDGNPTTGLTIQEDKTIRLDFAKPFTAEVLHIYIMVSAARFPIPVLIEVSDNGTDWREAGRVYAKGANSLQKLSFPRATARHWRLTVNEPLSPTTLSELCLLQKGERGVWDSAPGVAIAQPDDVIDLTDRMDADGTLRWSAPKGNWTVIRFGYTSNGKFNHPASPQGVGLECDKMDSTALDIHFKAFPEKLIQAAGPYAGKTFTYFLVDSWECGQQNWTAAFPEAFEDQQGYSLLPWIPVLCGERIGSAALSEAFVHDFDAVRGELVRVHYFKHLADLCHRAGMQLWSEGIYGGASMPPVDVLKSYEFCDVPMTEFWAQASEYRDWPIVYRPSNYGNHAIPYHVSLIYDKPVVGSEAFTGMALYSDSPIDLKLYGDQAYTQGVNRMVLHSYVHQPDDRRPGVTLGIYGQTFNRNNTWFNAADGFFATEARMQYLLQLGDRRADALVYLGDRLPNAEMTAAEIARTLPENIKFQYINQEVLLQRLSVRDGRIWLDGRHPFKFLVLRGDRMELGTARRVAELVDAGALVYGPKPVSTLSLKDFAQNNAALKEIADRLWDGGKVLTDLRSLQSAYTPDLRVRGIGIDDILWYHKTAGGYDYYYLSNKDNARAIHFEAVFDIPDGRPEIWDPMTGRVREQMMYTYDHGATVVPVTLQARQGLFVMLRRGGDRVQHIFRLTDLQGDQLFPNTTGDFSKAVPEAYRGADGEIHLRSLAAGSYLAGYSDAVACRIDLKAPERVVLDGTVGTMTFEDEPALGTMPIGGFREFTGFLDPRVKHYSGRVTYRTSAVLPEGFIKAERRVLIGIPAFGSTAQLTVNGHTLETIWDPAALTDITDFVRTGENEIVIQVTNPWRNRLIGDKAGVPSTEKHWTTSPLQQKHIPPQQILHEYALLYPAGISQPVTLYSEGVERVVNN